MITSVKIPILSQVKLFELKEHNDALQIGRWVLKIIPLENIKPFHWQWYFHPSNPGWKKSIWMALYLIFFLKREARDWYAAFQYLKNHRIHYIWIYGMFLWKSTFSFLIASRVKWMNCIWKGIIRTSHWDCEWCNEYSSTYELISIN